MYRDRLLDESRGQREAALAAYRNGLADFTEVMRAALSELDTRLAELRLAVDRAKAFADIDELAGLTEEANDAVD
ncbi:MAG: hypothetical protein KatS3mg121_0096 [Gammaproteobacteria bacterium]|nr:MAG: hypothetical protein KatS3mg121_0096 [Gammaproteobacteria bacterium]